MEKKTDITLNEEAVQPRRTWRDGLYGRLRVSVKTMDKVIIGISALLVTAVVAGILL